jgi:hypothetical protein
MGRPGTFTKGMSGNPAGRPKALVDVRDLARRQTTQNIETMIELRDGCPDANIRLKAANTLHEIAWGKPSQAVTGDGGGPIVLQWLDAAAIPSAAEDSEEGDSV